MSEIIQLVIEQQIEAVEEPIQDIKPVLEVISLTIKAPQDRSKYKNKYTTYNKEYHKKRYEENKDSYKLYEKDRRNQIKKGLIMLKMQGIILKDLV